VLIFTFFAVILIFCIMAGGKRAREGNSEPSCKCTTIDLELKLRMIRKYKGGQSLSASTRELSLAVSTVNTIVKNVSHIKEHVTGMACMKSMVIPKRCEGAITEMVKLLTIWMEDQIQKHVLLSLMMIQAKARSLFEDLKGKYPEGTQSCGGWFARFKNRAGFHNVQVSGEDPSGDIGYIEWWGRGRDLTCAKCYIHKRLQNGSLM
jgi:hypothetical protein